MITLEASRFMVACEDYESKVFIRDRNGIKEVTESMSDEDKNDLISDLIYVVSKLVKERDAHE
jgi:hypothetical protein|nr:MAG TPA: hypothetical protein [Bacteriophage sp.]